MAEGRGGRLLRLLRPYVPLFAATIGATIVASVLDGFTFVLMIPFLRTLFHQPAIAADGGSAVQALLRKISGPFLATRRAGGRAAQRRGRAARGAGPQERPRVPRRPTGRW